MLVLVAASAAAVGAGFVGGPSPAIPLPVPGPAPASAPSCRPSDLPSRGNDPTIRPYFSRGISGRTRGSYDASSSSPWSTPSSVQYDSSPSSYESGDVALSSSAWSASSLPAASAFGRDLFLSTPSDMSEEDTCTASLFSSLLLPASVSRWSGLSSEDILRPTRPHWPVHCATELYSHVMCIMDGSNNGTGHRACVLTGSCRKTDRSRAFALDFRPSIPSFRASSATSKS